MTDQEKNEVLAKWSGFVDYGGVAVYGPGDGSKKGWYDPDGNALGFHAGNLPDLLHSLDAQAKWLWPKLDYQKLEFEQGQWRAWVRWHSGEADSPAEACAEAVLSLIGSEVTV